MRGGEDGDILEAAPAHAGEPGDGKSTGDAPSCRQVHLYLYLYLYLPPPVDRYVGICIWH